MWELVNLSSDDIDLTGYTINTPYGHYILPDNSIIKRMKPTWEDDDGRDIQANEGMEGTGVPYEPLIASQQTNTTLSGKDLLMEDNKLLLAFDKSSLSEFIQKHYPYVTDIDERIVEPEMAELEFSNIMASIRRPDSAVFPLAKESDTKFRLFDVEEDVLTYNPEDKYVTLYDPAGNYLDSFKYRTTFNNVVVEIPGNADSPDLLVAPGYRGFESFERTDPTYFETELYVENREVKGRRAVPTMKLDAKNAIVTEVALSDGKITRGRIGGSGNMKDPSNSRITRFIDTNPVPSFDAHWNGWDFIGDRYQYPKEAADEDRFNLWKNLNAIASEAVPSSGQLNRFYKQLGGFENATEIAPESRETLDEYRIRVETEAPLTAFIWRMGLREFIRAGYDPMVDDQLTVRVLGRKYIDRTGIEYDVDLPVGEVMVTPVYRILNPGENDIEDAEPQEANENPKHIYSINGDRKPVFAKLRNGDTAFTIDLRKSFDSLRNGWPNADMDEPIIEIAVIMRKTTRDLSPEFQSIGSGSRNAGWIYPEDRPDLAVTTLMPDGQPLAPDPQGYYNLTSMGDDNYFFRGIELFGRGRADNQDTDNANELRSLLAGTPGWDNTGYVPAYPRQRMDLVDKRRDRYDIIDNTAYVKNGPLATVGEISRLFTGNKFETINTPIIPQRLEDIAIDSQRIISNPQLAALGRSRNDYRIQLAQRERLDQWENQYTQIYNMITTAENGIVPGLVNINTAPREALSALPSTPLDRAGQPEALQQRHFFNSIVSDFIIEGRQPGGHDMFFGVHNLDDDKFMEAFLSRSVKNAVDVMTEYKFRSTGRADERDFKEFEDIKAILDLYNISPTDVSGKSEASFDQFAYPVTIVSDPDDGPYADIGTLLAQLTHLRRRERCSERLLQRWDRTGDLKINAQGDLRERLNRELNRRMTTEDMEALMNRISNLITVRSRTFGIKTLGQIFDQDQNVEAQRKFEAVYQR